MKVPWNLFRGRGDYRRTRSRRVVRPVIEILEDRMVLSTMGPSQQSHRQRLARSDVTRSTTRPPPRINGTVTSQSMEDSLAHRPAPGHGQIIPIAAPATPWPSSTPASITTTRTSAAAGATASSAAGTSSTTTTTPWTITATAPSSPASSAAAIPAYLGIAPNVDFVALKVLDSTGSGTFGNVDLALQWVAAHQAQYNIVAVNMSLGSGNYTADPFTFLETDFQTLVKDNVFISVAAGNSYYTYGSAPGLAYPAVSPNGRLGRCDLGRQLRSGHLGERRRGLHHRPGTDHQLHAARCQPRHSRSGSDDHQRNSQQSVRHRSGHVDVDAGHHRRGGAAASGPRQSRRTQSDQVSRIC